MGFFNSDNFLIRFLDRVGDIIILNLLFLLCCIPVITIGASFTALQYSCLKIVKDDGTIPRKNFFRSFKENFRQSTILWLGFLIVAAILFTNFRFLRYTDSGLSVPLRYLSYGATAFFLFLFLYIFPVTAAFRNSLGNLVKNAMMLAFMHLPSTLCIAVIWIFPVYLTLLDLKLFGLYLFCWVGFAFATLAYLSATLFYRIFKKYLPEEDISDTAPKEESSAQQ